MTDNLARPMSPPDSDSFHDDVNNKSIGNFRVSFRGRGGGFRGKHRHTQSSAAVLHRSAYSTGSLSAAIQSEYARTGMDNSKFGPMPPPQEGGGANKPITPKESWQQMGAQILGSTISPTNGEGTGQRNPRTPVRNKSKSKFNLSLDLSIGATAVVEEDVMPAKESIVNKFAQELLRTYPPELAASLALIDNSSSGNSPSHRRAVRGFVIEDVNTAAWLNGMDSDMEQTLQATLQTLRSSAARSIEAYRRSKTNSPNNKKGSGSSSALQKEAKELEAELISALESEIKGLRVERQRMEVKYARLKEKNGALVDQMKSFKEELDHLKALPAVADEKHRRDTMAGSPKNADAAQEGSEDSEAVSAKITALENEVQEKALALKSVRKQFVDVLIKQQRAEKINLELQNELEGEKTRVSEVTEKLHESDQELENLRDVLKEHQLAWDDKTEEVDTMRLDHAQETRSLTEKYEERIAALEAKIRSLEDAAKKSQAVTKQTGQLPTNLVKEMGAMLTMAIEQSMSKSEQAEHSINQQPDGGGVDTSDMFTCSNCKYINASIRLVCAACHTKRFPNLRDEKQRKTVRKKWVNGLVNMYLNMLEEILKTERGQEVVKGEAKHNNRSGKPISQAQIHDAELKIQKMLQSAATQKGKQRFSQVYPKMAEPLMKNAVTKVIAANRVSSPKHNKSPSGSGSSGRPTRSTEPLNAGDQVFAKWHGADRELYPDWYEAKVHEVHGENSYVVEYMNGERCANVPRIDIRKTARQRSR